MSSLYVFSSSLLSKCPLSHHSEPLPLLPGFIRRPIHPLPRCKSHWVRLFMTPITEIQALKGLRLPWLEERLILNPTTFDSWELCSVRFLFIGTRVKAMGVNENILHEFYLITGVNFFEKRLVTNSGDNSFVWTSCDWIKGYLSFSRPLRAADNNLFALPPRISLPLSFLVEGSSGLSLPLLDCFYTILMTTFLPRGFQSLSIDIRAWEGKSDFYPNTTKRRFVTESLPAPPIFSTSHPKNWHVLLVIQKWLPEVLGNVTTGRV